MTNIFTISLTINELFLLILKSANSFKLAYLPIKLTIDAVTKSDGEKV
jgi:hypothetical protein